MVSFQGPAPENKKSQPDSEDGQQASLRALDQLFERVAADPSLLSEMVGPDFPQELCHTEQTGLGIDGVDLSLSLISGIVYSGSTEGLDAGVRSGLGTLSTEVPRLVTERHAAKAESLLVRTGVASSQILLSHHGPFEITSSDVTDARYASWVTLQDHETGELLLPDVFSRLYGGELASAEPRAAERFRVGAVGILLLEDDRGSLTEEVVLDHLALDEAGSHIGEQAIFGASSSVQLVEHLAQKALEDEVEGRYPGLLQTLNGEGVFELLRTRYEPELLRQSVLSIWMTAPDPRSDTLFSLGAQPRWVERLELKMGLDQLGRFEFKRDETADPLVYPQLEYDGIFLPDDLE